MYDLAMDEIDELRKELQAAQEENKRLKGILADGICKTCGGVSWDIPLDDYCRCEKSRKDKYAIVPTELLDRIEQARKSEAHQG